MFNNDSYRDNKVAKKLKRLFLPSEKLKIFHRDNV